MQSPAIAKGQVSRIPEPPSHGPGFYGAKLNEDAIDEGNEEAFGCGARKGCSAGATAEGRGAMKGLCVGAEMLGTTEGFDGGGIGAGRGTTRGG